MPTTDSYGSVATPRIYVDYVQYAKALGMIEDYNTADGITEDPSLAWDFNPSKMTSYTVTEQTDNIVFKVDFKLDNNQFKNLLSGMNYFMVLGLDSTQVTPGTSNISYLSFSDYSGGGVLQFPELGGSNQLLVGVPVLENYLNYIDTLGYSVQIWDGFTFQGNEDETSFESLSYSFSSDTDFYIGDVLKIGTFSAGKYFDFPYSPDLNVNISVQFPGVKTKVTSGGSGLMQMNYGRKKWGDLVPWTSIDVNEYPHQGNALVGENYTGVGNNSNRVFKINYSYVDKEDMFPKNFEGNIIGNDDGNGLFDEDESIFSSFMNFTLGGQIPFIFQPDNTKQDFAICKLDKPSHNIKQEANGVYSISMTFREI